MVAFAGAAVCAGPVVLAPFMSVGVTTTTITAAAEGVGAVLGYSAVVGEAAVLGAAAGVQVASGATAIATVATGSVAAAEAGAALAAGAGALNGVAGVVTTGAAIEGAWAGAATASMLMGPVGLALVGAQNETSGYTWDCWKPVVLDDSVGPSCGVTLRELHGHPNLHSMTLAGDGFRVENVIGQKFVLSPVYVDGTLAFHATLA